MIISADGLIDPSRFAVKSSEIAGEPVELAATEMARMGASVRAGTSGIADSWRGLAGAYQAPEQASIHGLVRPAVEMAENIDTRLARGSRAVARFADTLRGIKPRLADLEVRAGELRDRARWGWVPEMDDGGGSGWRDDLTLVRANDDLVHEYSRLMAQLAQASEECEDELRKLAATREAGPAPPDSPLPDGERGREAPLPRVIIREENPAHLELDLVGLLPVVGEPADLINALIYAWEQDWDNAAISALAVAPVVGSLGTLARIGARTNGMQGSPPRLTQARLEHIVRRHWWTSGSRADVGRFADNMTLSMLTSMIDAALRHGRIRSNTRDRVGTIYEIDVVRIIGISGDGHLTSRLRVIVGGDGEILSAFPY